MSSLVEYIKHKLENGTLFLGMFKKEKQHSHIKEPSAKQLIDGIEKTFDKYGFKPEKAILPKEEELK